MDQLDSPAMRDLGPPPVEGRGPGRPAVGAAQRAMNDEKYAKMQDLLEALPQEAKEFRLAVYPARRSGKSKAQLHPLETILFSEYKEQNFGDRQALSDHLEEKHGEGRYLIEWLDEHDSRLVKIPTYVINAGEDMDGDFDDDEPRGGWNRGRRRSRRDDDYDDDEDPVERRANVADMLSATARAQSSQVGVVAKQSGDMMSMLMFTSQQQAETRAAEERRREESRAEERRREEARAEERRREAETERKEREEREERRREEARDREKRDDDRRREESLALMNVSNKRTELMVGAFTALVPVLGKMFEKKEDTTLPLLLKLSEKKDDPIALMLLKSVVDKSNDDSATKNMFLQFGEMSKITAQMTADQMRSMMALSNDMNGTIMKKAMEMMLQSPQGQTPEGRNFIEQVMGALGSAAEIVKTLVPAQPAPATPPRRAHIAAPTAAQPGAADQPAAAVAAEQPAQPAKEMTQAEKEWAAMTPEEQAAAQAAQPRGTAGVLSALMLIQTKRYTNQAEYQSLIQFLVAEMPLDLRVAVLDADQATVLAICQPVIQATPELSAWIFQPGVLDQIQSFVAQLPPSLVAVHGPADAQRAQYAAQKTAATAPPVDAATTPVETAVASVVDTAPIPGPGSVPVAAALPDDGPQVPLPDAAPTGGTVSPSHLDDDDKDAP